MITSDLLTAPLYSWADLQSDRGCPPRRPGVYAWFFHVPPDGVPCEGCITRNGLTLLYVGISPGSGESKETLRTRIRYHYRGNAEGSTLRLTLGVLLESTLGTVLRRVGSGTRLTFDAAEARLSQWMAANAQISWLETEQPWKAEAELIRTLVLPLNIEQNSHHTFHPILRSLRSAARRRAREAPVVERREPREGANELTHRRPEGGDRMTPMERVFQEAWKEFRDYAKDHMGYTNATNRNECLNGAGAFVDFLCGRKPRMGTKYATSEKWPTGE